MSKRRRGVKRPPAAPIQPPPVTIPPEAILAETWLLRHMLTRCGVPAWDRDDVLQECLIGAVVAVREGRYRPQPGLHPRRILQRWLVGIAVRQAAKYHEKSYRRHEVAVPDPRAYVAGWVPSPHGEVEARALLELLWLVEPRERRVLILVGEGEQVSQVARNLGLPLGTAFSRLRRGRIRLAAVLKRRRPLQ
ncbi:RNA polymerase sigma factor [Sorangium sp. So ce542]|uniref:RNA polymerase sigma factor n=1 Tax=Sorangium sp. So ce542 TaxID=3133316 RepID=UPI003F5EF4FD